MRILDLLLVSTGVTASVIEADDKNIDTYLSKNIPTIVDLYATWCSHCKQFAPVFEELSNEYEHLQDRIQFITVNVDKNRKTSKRFDLQYIPTIKFVDGDKIEEIDSRDPAALKEYIKSNVGITPETPKVIAKKISRESAESHILNLVDETFRDAIDGKHALVAFTTQWCGYCKMLAPVWGQLAKLYARDDDVAIVNIDCTDEESVSILMQQFEVDAFPTLVYVPANPSRENLPKRYAGPRELKGFVDFFADMGISHRNEDGTLRETAGVIPHIDLNLIPDYAALLAQVREADSKYETFYERVLSKAQNDSAYLMKESKRLASLLKGNLSPADSDNLQIKLNIVNSILDAIPKEKDEL